MIAALETATRRDPEYPAAEAEPRREQLYRAWEACLLREARATYDARGRFWPWDFSSIAAYERSMDRPRRRFKALLGGWPARRVPLVPRYELLAGEEATGGRYRLERVWFTVAEGVEVDALLLTPPTAADGPRPAVLAQHGINGTPEIVVGVVPGAEQNAYRRLGIRLVERGYVVLAPHMVGGYGNATSGGDYIPELVGKPEGRARNQLHRIAIEYGRTLLGLELFMLSRAVDLLAAHPNVDPARIGVYGLSLGGSAALRLAALDTRVAAAVVSGDFNERFGKQVLRSKRGSFMQGTSEFQFFHGRLRAFGDAEVASLICPRPLCVEHGKRDGIGWWEEVQAEFARVQGIYERLGIADRSVFALHEEGHVALGEQSFPFLDRWLRPDQPPGNVEALFPERMEQ